MSALIQTKSSLTAWERWELASFDLPHAPVAASGSKHETEAPVFSEAQIAKLREEARLEGEAAGRTAGYEAGYAEGRPAGYAAGHAEGQATGHAEGTAKGQALAEAIGREEAEKLMQLALQLENRINELSPSVADDLLALSLEVARQVIRQTVEHRPGALLAVIREALAQLPLQQAAIHLHPEDAALVRRHAGEELSHAGHRLREDPKLERGDVVIESGSSHGGSHLDATLASRWMRVVATLGQSPTWLPPGEQ